MHFMQEFGLILFVYSIGLQVGPGFFSSFKKGGMTLNLLATGIVLLNVAVACTIYFLANGRVEMPIMVGILSGAVTNTPIRCSTANFSPIAFRRETRRSARNRFRLCSSLSFRSFRYYPLNAYYTGYI